MEILVESDNFLNFQIFTTRFEFFDELDPDKKHQKCKNCTSLSCVIISLRKRNDIGRRETASFSPGENRRKHTRHKPAQAH